MNKTKFKGVLAAGFSVLIWGTTFIVTKGLMNSFNAAEILFARFIVAYLLLLPTGIKETRPENAKKDEWIFFLVAFTGLFLYGVLEILSMEFTYTSNTSTIVSSNPFFIAIFSVIFLKNKRPSALFFIGFVVSMVGIGIISFNGATEFGLNPLGDFLALGSAISWGFYTVLIMMAYNRGYSTVCITRKTYFWGAIIMFVSLPFFGINTDFSRFANVQNLLGLLFLGVVASCICFLTWSYATKVLGPVESSVFIYVIPAVTIVFASVFLKEKINAMSIMGIMLVIAGTVLSSVKIEKKGE